MPQTLAPERPYTAERPYAPDRDQRIEGDNRPLTGLFSDLWRETLDLFREETELAKAELSEKVSQVQSGMVELSAGALVLYAGFLVILAAISIGLAMALPEPYGAWLGPVIVGAVVMLIGGIMLSKGRSNMKARNLRPERTMEEMRRNVQLGKEHAR